MEIHPFVCIINVITALHCEVFFLCAPYLGNREHFIGPRLKTGGYEEQELWIITVYHRTYTTPSY